MITLSGKEWARIHQEIAREFPPSHLLIREVMRRELGFTTRQHTHWDDNNNQHVSILYLDFYDDAKETWFTLKYLNRD
jgi:hypothetical protein